MAPAKLYSRDNIHHTHFIEQFTHQESNKRISKKRAPLSAKQREALREQLKDVCFLKPDYADNTKINIAGILRKWKTYCKANNLGQWKTAIQNADRAMAMDFLDHMCEQSNIQSEGTSWEYWRQYKQLYASVNGRFVDRNDSREVLKWHDTYLVPRYRLRPPNIKGKPVVGPGDLLALLTFNIAYDTGIFSLERHRVNLPGIYLFLSYTGARPAEIVDNEKKKPKDGSYEDLWDERLLAREKDDSEDTEATLNKDSQVLEGILTQETEGRGRPKALCYEDVLLMVVRHPETGEDRLAMAVKLIHHKGADNKPKPTIFLFTSTKRLMFCPILVLISLALADGAFAAQSITSPSKLFQVKNQGPVKSTAFRWKQEWLKRPIFRVCDESAPNDYRPVPYHKLRDDMTRQTLDAGFEDAIGPKAFRRGAANAANGNAPDAVRDQIMRHDPKWATFNSAYVNEKVEFDLQNAFLDEPLEESLITLFTHISIMRDPRASYDMVPEEVWNTLPPDPDIVKLETQRARLKNGQYRMRGTDQESEVLFLNKEINKKRKQRKKALRQEYRKYYFHNRPTWDIERQLAEDGPEELEDDIQPPIQLCIPERKQLAEIFCHQPDNLNANELRNLRIKAADLMMALCNKKETAKRKIIRQKAQAVHTDSFIKQESPRPDCFPLLMDKTQCPCCIGSNIISQEERTFCYSRPAVMNNHFERAHLKALRQEELENRITCKHPLCQERGEDSKLVSVDHFRNHVQRVHGVWLRPERK